MYVIGRSPDDLIRIENVTMYDGKDISVRIRTIFYNVMNEKSTIISDYELAESLLEEIQRYYDHISFFNDSLLANIIEKDSFEKEAYVKELKIYKLVPVELD